MSENLKIDPYGFREYDARWLYPEEINKKGLELFGYGLGKFIIENSKGNTKLTTLQYEGADLTNATCIGAYDDGANETIYWFIKL